METRTMWRAGVFAACMLGSTFLALAWRPTAYLADMKPPIELESLVPKVMGEWTVDTSIVPLQPAPDLQKVIAETYDQTMARTYRNAQGQRVMLSIAYGRNQHEGMNTHRPEICYPGQGLPIVSGSSRRSAPPLLGQPVEMTQLVARSGSRNEPITYWLIVGDTVTHYGRAHKLVTLEYGLLGKIPDGMLIRVSSIDVDNDGAFAVHQRFIADMLGAMTPAARIAMLGRVALPA